VLSRLSAPLSVHAILGNHDWWDDLAAQQRGHRPTYGGLALEDAGIRVYENDVAKPSEDG
jgi:predicted MPP superfamily phosphohydrolase